MVLEVLAEREVLEGRVLEDGEEHLGRGVFFEQGDERLEAELTHLGLDDPERNKK